MSSLLLHSPGDILRAVLVSLGLGSDPDVIPASATSWPIYSPGEPGVPDNVITVRSTSNRDQGRVQVDGGRLEKYGIQVRIRSGRYTVGLVKAYAITDALDKDLYQEVVTLDSTRYLVHAFSRSSGVLDLGKDAKSERSLFTINGLATIRLFDEPEPAPEVVYSYDFSDNGNSFYVGTV